MINLLRRNVEMVFSISRFAMAPVRLFQISNGGMILFSFGKGKHAPIPHFNTVCHFTPIIKNTSKYNMTCNVGRNDLGAKTVNWYIGENGILKCRVKKVKQAWKIINQSEHCFASSLYFYEHLQLKIFLKVLAEIAGLHVTLTF